MKDLTARKIGNRIGMSPALLNYHFGSQAGLLEEACREADRRLAAAWREWTETISAVRPGPDDFEACMYSAIRDMHSRMARERTMLWQSLLKASRQTGFQLALQSPHTESVFWHLLLSLAGIDEGHADSVQSFALGLGFGYLVNGEPWTFDSWAHRLCGRFASRLLKRETADEGDSAFRRASELPFDEMAETPALHPTHQKIIEAAVEIILSKGAEELTHRAIAAEAGVSLSSVTHFVKSGADLRAEAHEALFARTRSQVDPLRRSQTPMSVAKLVDAMLGSGGTASMGVRMLAGTYGAMLSASVLGDSRDLVRHTFARFGASTIDLIARTFPTGTPLSRLDAQVFSLCAANLRFVGMLKAEQPLEALEKKHRRDFRVLIGTLFPGA
ncbi:MAG: hypothetical protein R3C13_07610 [Hyphomonas sp.]|uniref:hypothetical protein n=1 Tax=Hyphomonas sp. TaxID=87 RepID=UPI0035281FFE